MTRKSESMHDVTFFLIIRGTFDSLYVSSLHDDMCITYVHMSRNGTVTYVRVSYIRIFINSHCIHGTFTRQHSLLIRISIVRNGPNIEIRVIVTIILLRDFIVFIVITKQQQQQYIPQTIP